MTTQTKRELLQACARTMRPLVKQVLDLSGEVFYVWVLRNQPFDPISNSGDCFTMNAEKRVDMWWYENPDRVFAEVTQGQGDACWLAYIADHPSPEAAARWASCMAVAATAGEKG